MEPEDLAAVTKGSIHAYVDAVVEKGPQASEGNKAEEIPFIEPQEENEDEKIDPVIEAIQANGRLFVRNLPYTATEDDLRKHFEPYGALEEVGIL